MLMTDLPLSSIRVVDLSRVFAMPYVGAYLANTLLRFTTPSIPSAYWLRSGRVCAREVRS